MVKEKDFIPSLTGIRAICAYFIFFYHINIFSEHDQPALHILLNQFNTFLTFFFVLSGFIICHKYYEISSLKKKALYNYFVNRVSRVFPILFILITITFFLQYIYHQDTLPNILKTYFYNITLIKGFSKEYILTGIGPSWSMSVEELFYALSPVLFSLSLKKRALLKYVVLLYTAGILLTFIFHHVGKDQFFGDYIFTFYFTFFGRAFEFACGIFLALVIKGKLSPGILAKAGKLNVYIGSVIILSGITALYFIAAHYNVIHACDTWQGVFVNNIVMPVGITFFFYGLIYHESFLQKILSTKLMVLLGAATYSFYLMHTTFVLSWIQKFISKNILIVFVSMIIVSYIFYKLVEQPLAKFLRKRFTIK